MSRQGRQSQLTERTHHVGVVVFRRKGGDEGRRVASAPSKSKPSPKQKNSVGITQQPRPAYSVRPSVRGVRGALAARRRLGGGCCGLADIRKNWQERAPVVVRRGGSERCFRGVLLLLRNYVIIRLKEDLSLLENN